MKSSPKSCSCTQCKHGKTTKPGKERMKRAERAFRHGAKQAINQGREDITPAPKTDRIS